MRFRLRLALAIGMSALLAAPGVGSERNGASATATRSASTELAVRIEGQTSGAARREAVRQFLLEGGETVEDEILTLLAGSSRTAQLAVAYALADLSQSLRVAWIEPLQAMLGDADAEFRSAASGALAAYPDDRSVTALRAVLLDSSMTVRARLAALDALDRICTPAAVGAIVQALDEATPTVRDQAMASLDAIAGRPFGGRRSEIDEWWSEAQRDDAERWRARRMARLERRANQLERQAREIESRFVASLRDGFLRASEADRPAMLQSLLSDALVSVRLMGLSLAQTELSQGRAVSPESAERIRELLAAPEGLIRAAAVRAVAGLRDPADEARLLEILSAETGSEVRAAVANALGYIGGTAAAPRLVELLTSDDSAVLEEAVTAIGRLVKRVELSDSATRAIADGVLALGETIAERRVATRERLLWTMSRIADVRYTDVFVAALRPEEASAIRVAALRGVAALMESMNGRALPQTLPAQRDGVTGEEAGRPVAGALDAQRAALMKHVAAAAHDGDTALRRAAIEALAQLSWMDSDLEELWRVVIAGEEHDDDERELAWRGLVRALGGRTVAEIEPWIERLPPNGEHREHRRIELLLLAERIATAEPVDRAALGSIRVRIGRARAAAGQVESAVSAYLAGMDDLLAVEDSGLASSAVELTALSVRTGFFESEFAKRLAQRTAGLPAEAFWEPLLDALASGLTGESADRMVGALGRLRETPPVAADASVLERITRLREAAIELRRESEREIVAAALAELAADPDNAEALERIISRGRGAAPAVRDALLSLISADGYDRERERRLVDLLKQLVPGWSAYRPDDGMDQKVLALQQLEA